MWVGHYPFSSGIGLPVSEGDGWCLCSIIAKFIDNPNSTALVKLNRINMVILLNIFMSTQPFLFVWFYCQQNSQKPRRRPLNAEVCISKVPSLCINAPISGIHQW